MLKKDVILAKDEVSHTLYADLDHVWPRPLAICALHAALHMLHGMLSPMPILTAGPFASKTSWQD